MPAPTISPNSGGPFQQSVLVSIADANTAATIRYTLDGSDPTPTNGTDYTAPFALTSTTTVSARAFISGGGQSAVTRADFPIFSVTAAFTSDTSEVDLASIGTSDWIHFGDASVVRKASGASQIVAALSGASAYSGDPRPMRWTGGSPIGNSTNNTNGLLKSATSSSFQLTVPAGIAPRTVYVYAGGSKSRGTLTAKLSGRTVTDYTSPQTGILTGVYDRTFAITYQATTPGQFLVISWTLNTTVGTGVNLRLSGAALTAP